MWDAIISHHPLALICGIDYHDEILFVIGCLVYLIVNSAAGSFGGGMSEVRVTSRKCYQLSVSVTSQES